MQNISSQGRKKEQSFQPRADRLHPSSTSSPQKKQILPTQETTLIFLITEIKNHHHRSKVFVATNMRKFAKTTFYILSIQEYHHP